ncbi:peritrophin-1-like [Uranotaenia lowii]|uniref:peritrophin-1-like n=1 Tax=Uranotaenia lowii TaxID=190385 RepID=UPI00247AC9F9|nr:peritrophin-1-like [Uranotaenia lowii]
MKGNILALVLTLSLFGMSSANLCVGLTEGFFIYAADCTKYISCANEQENIMSCPAGYIYDHARVLCVRGTTCPPVPVTPVCPPTGIEFQAIEGDCEHYIVCSQGVAHTMTCAAGTTFDTPTLKCQLPAASTCLPFKCDPALPLLGQSFADPADCTKYYICNFQYELVPKACSAGMHWDDAIKKCAAGACV